MKGGLPWADGPGVFATTACDFEGRGGGNDNMRHKRGRTATHVMGRWSL